MTFLRLQAHDCQSRAIFGRTRAKLAESGRAGNHRPKRSISADFALNLTQVWDDFNRNWQNLTRHRPNYDRRRPSRHRPSLVTFGPELAKIEKFRTDVDRCSTSFGQICPGVDQHFGNLSKTPVEFDQMWRTFAIPWQHWHRLDEIWAEIDRIGAEFCEDCLDFNEMWATHET